jgi:hypothetical protein
VAPRTRWPHHAYRGSSASTHPASPTIPEPRGSAARASPSIIHIGTPQGTPAMHVSERSSKSLPAINRTWSSPPRSRHAAWLPFGVLVDKERKEVMTLHQIIEVDPKAYGNTDLWSFDLLEVGRPLPCNNLRTFLHYLCSSGTRVGSIGTYSDDAGSGAAVEVVLKGPRADDGEILSVTYRLR